MFQAICRIVAEVLQVERAGIWLYVNDRSAIRCVCLCERSKHEFSEGTTLQVSDFPNYFANLETRRTLSADSAPHDPRTNELQETYLAPLGISSLVDAPIFLNGEIYGVACHEHVGPMREWTTEERDFASSVADLVALKIKGEEMEQLRDVIHDRDADRAALRQRECIASLADGVAHDFRNLLMAINFGARELIDKNPANSSQTRVAREILQTAECGAAMIAELMAVGRGEGRHPQVVDPVAAVKQFLPTLQRAVGSRHEIEFQGDNGIGRVFIEPSRLERVVLNLAINARDAMVSGGKILLSITGGNIADNRHVTVAVEDKGGGIPLTSLERIFDPFFTTKPRGQGTALGLTIVKQAVEHAGGKLHVENRPPVGAKFIVTLPRVSAS